MSGSKSSKALQFAAPIPIVGDSLGSPRLSVMACQHQHSWVSPKWYSSKSHQSWLSSHIKPTLDIRSWRPFASFMSHKSTRPIAAYLTTATDPSSSSKWPMSDVRNVKPQSESISCGKRLDIDETHIQASQITCQRTFKLCVIDQRNMINDFCHWSYCHRLSSIFLLPLLSYNNVVSEWWCKKCWWILAIFSLILDINNASELWNKPFGK